MVSTEEVNLSVTQHGLRPREPRVRMGLLTKTEKADHYLFLLQLPIQVFLVSWSPGTKVQAIKRAASASTPGHALLSQQHFSLGTG